MLIVIIIITRERERSGRDKLLEISAGSLSFFLSLSHDPDQWNAEPGYSAPPEKPWEKFWLWVTSHTERGAKLHGCCCCCHTGVSNVDADADVDATDAMKKHSTGRPGVTNVCHVSRHLSSLDKRCMKEGKQENARYVYVYRATGKLVLLK